LALRQSNKHDARSARVYNRHMKDKPTQLYRAYDRNGDLLYVGISLSTINRASQHQRDAAWFSEMARMEVELFDTREAAVAAEQIAIKTEEPKHNVCHNRPPPEAYVAPSPGEFRATLKSLGITQRWLAGRLGVETSTVNRWAQGTLPVPQYAVFALILLDYLKAADILPPPG
jgi:DNA-binding transcriptional regulator YiaG